MSDTHAADIRIQQGAGYGLAELIAGKLHGLKVTECRLDYHGSITIDADILEAARMLPLEFVYIWNTATGARISTYILPGERGSGVCCLNGAAARSCQPGDEVIVASSRRVESSAVAGEGFAMSPRVIMFRHARRPNEIAEVLEYRASVQDGVMHFEMAPVPLLGA